MQAVFDSYEMAGEGSVTAEVRGAVVREAVRAGGMKRSEESGERQSSGRASSKRLYKNFKKNYKLSSSIPSVFPNKVFSFLNAP